MNDKKQAKTKQGLKLEVPRKQTVTMLDYEGQPVVTYSVVDKRAKPSRDAS